MRYVYVGQYDWVWRLGLDEWRALCERQLAPDATGYDLEPYRRLKRRPAWLIKDRESGDVWVIRTDVRFVQPLDWTSEDFAEELASLAAKSLP